MTAQRTLKLRRKRMSGSGTWMIEGAEGGMTEEDEMEEYRRKRQMAADPMAKFLSNRESV